MILRSIRVEGVRRFRNPVELTGLGLGAHVVYAPNEAGKSTVFTAVARALCDKYSTRGAEIEDLKPWGTDLSPIVTLEIDVNGKRYRLRKRFLDGAESFLDEWNGTVYERLADAQQSDDRVRSFIGGALPGRGATSIDHWGVARLLWIQQEPHRHELPDMTEPLRQRLLALVGATTLAPGEQLFVDKIRAVFDEYFTPTGQPRKGSAIWEGAQKLSAAREEVSRWKQSVEQAAAAGEELAGTEVELASLDAESKSHRVALAELRERTKNETDLEKQLAVKREEVARLKERFVSIDSQKRALVELEEKRERARKLMANLVPAMDEVRPAAEQRGKARDQAAEACAGARSDLDEAERKLERARAIEKALQLAENRRRLNELVAKADRIAASLAKKATEVTGAAPTEAEVKKAEALEKEIAQLETRLEAIGLEVAFTADSAANITWKTAAGQELKRPKAGDRVVFRGADAGSLTIAGVGVVRVRSGAQDVSRLKEELTERRAELDRRLGERQAKHVSQLREAREIAKTREQEIASLEGKLADVLTDDFETLDAGRGALRKVSGQLAECLGQLGLDETGLETEKGIDIKRPAEDVKLAKARLAALEEDSKKAAAAAREVDKRLADLEKERAGHEREVKTLDAQHVAAVAANGPLDDLAAEAIRVAGESAMADAACQAFAARLPPIEQRAAALQQRTEDAIARIAQKEKEARDRFSRGMALLERAGAEGAYSRLCDAEENVALLEAECAREQHRAEAAKLLHGFAESQREKASRSLVDPVEKAVRTRLDYLRGQAAPHVEIVFGDGLSTLEVAPREDSRSPFHALSWGAQEQTMFALRLSLGAMLSRDGKEPQLVVLDDALVNTDTLRHGRALDLVQSAAEQMQVVILTAFPDRYRALKAREYDLAALARG